MAIVESAEPGGPAQGQTIVKVDPRYFRPTEVDTLLGDPALAHNDLGWKPKTSFQELMREMTLSDLELAKRDSLVTDAGFKTYNFNE